MNEHTEKHISIWERLRQGRRSEGVQEELEQDLQHLWDCTDDYGQAYEPDVEAGLRSLRHKLSDEQQPSVARVRRLSPRMGLRYAAAVAVVLVAAVATYFYVNSTEAPAGEWLSVTTGTEETRVLVLPDGSEITLNANTTLAYRSDMAQAQQRLIELQGEAFFDVQRRPEQPFIISMDRAEVEVLGTSFNLRSYPGEDFTEVEVASGKVAFRGRQSTKELVLQAEEAAVLNGAENLLKLAAPNLNRQAWRTNRLFFKDTQLSDAAPLIERYFNVEFQWAKEAANCPLTGDWQSESIDEVIELIEALTSLQVRKIGEHTYRLEGQCQ